VPTNWVDSAVQFTVQVAFASDPFTSSPSWTDVSDYVRDIRVQRGKSDALDQVQPGQLEIRLRNEDRRFDPDYSSGAYAPNVVPRKPVRVFATYSATDYDLFYGYVDEWVQDYRSVADTAADVLLRATDVFGLFAQAELVSPWEQYVASLTPESWMVYSTDGSRVVRNIGVKSLPMTTALPMTVTESLISGKRRPALAVNLVGVNTGQSVKLLGSSLGSDYHSGTGSPDFYNNYIVWESWFRVDSLPAADSVIFTFNRTVGHRLRLTTAGLLIYDDSGNNSITIGTVELGKTYQVFHKDANIYLDGRKVANVVGGAGTPYIGNDWGVFDGALDEIVIYGETLGPSGTVPTDEQILTLYELGSGAWAGDTTNTRIDSILTELGFPAGLRDLTGTTEMSAYQASTNALAEMQAAADAEAGRFYVTADGIVTLQPRQYDLEFGAAAYTFGDNAPDLPYSELTPASGVRTIMNRASVPGPSGELAEYEDSTSITDYGVSARSLPTMASTRAEDAYHYAAWVVQQRKNPTTRFVQMRVNVRRSLTTLVAASTSELGTKLTVKRTPQGVGTAISKDVFIEGVTHTISPDNWVTEFLLSPAPVDTGLARWGTGTWDTDSWGF
jgi:hypothetical protein